MLEELKAKKAKLSEADLRLPWEFTHTITDADGAPAIVDADRCVIAFMSDDGRDEDAADEIADWLVAAVNSLDALIEVAEAAKGLMKSTEDDADAIIRLRAALSKLEGTKHE